MKQKETEFLWILKYDKQYTLRPLILYIHLESGLCHHQDLQHSVYQNSVG